MKQIILIFSVGVLLMGCTTTKYVEVERVRTDTLYKSKTVFDSIYVHDSTIIERKGDTVFVNRWHDRWRDRWNTDTIYKSRTDSIPYPVEVVKEVPAELTWWQQTRLHIGEVSIALIILVIIVFIVKKRLL